MNKNINLKKGDLMLTTNNSQADNFLREVKEETAKNSYASNDIVVVTSYLNEKPETITY